MQEENEDNQLTINILNDKEGWTIVRRKKKKKKQTKTDKSDGWNKQQKINFELYDNEITSLIDIYFLRKVLLHQTF